MKPGGGGLPFAVPGTATASHRSQPIATSLGRCVSSQSLRRTSGVTCASPYPSQSWWGSLFSGSISQWRLALHVHALGVGVGASPEVHLGVGRWEPALSSMPGRSHFADGLPFSIQVGTGVGSVSVGSLRVRAGGSRASSSSTARTGWVTMAVLLPPLLVTAGGHGCAQRVCLQGPLGSCSLGTRACAPNPRGGC